MRKSKIFQFLSIILAVVFTVSVVPFGVFTAIAADGFLTIQLLKNGVVQPNVELKLDVDGTSVDYISSITNNIGVWKTEVRWNDLADNFTIYINGDRKEISKSSEEKDYLIINTDEVNWTNGLMPIEKVSISADKNFIKKGESFSVTAIVKGTPESYQWYFNGTLIPGATRNSIEIENAKLSDSGKYSCKVSDYQGSSRTSEDLLVSVNEIEASATFKAYANGIEINNNTIDRTKCNEIEVKISNLPLDANITNIKYYLNDSCVVSETTDLSYKCPISSITDYTFKAAVTFDRYYAEKILNIPTITADLHSQNSVSIDFSEEVLYDSSTGEYMITYSKVPEDLSFSATLSGGLGSGDYSLEITEEKRFNDINLYSGEIASLSKINPNKWTVSVNGAGLFKLKASKNGDGTYGSIESPEITVRVNKADTEGFAFVNPTPDAVTYNENGNKFENKIVDGFENVEYSIEDGIDIATIDKSVGVVTILRSGTITVKASLSGSANYNSVSAYYTLTINKADQAISFEEKTDSIYYGQKYARVASLVKNTNAADGLGYNNDFGVSIQYSIVSVDGLDAIATVDNNGVLSFADERYGSVTVKATVPANDCYNEVEATYTVIVKEYTVENGYSVNGLKKIAESDWYSDTITVIPTTGHEISRTGSLSSTNEWSQSVIIDTEGDNNGCTIYLKNTETGAISKGYEIESEYLKLDKSSPEKGSLRVIYKTNAWYEEALDVITFGYYNSSIKFYLEASDGVSGLKSFNWKLVSDLDSTVLIDEKTVSATKKENVYISEDIVLGNEDDLEELRGKIAFSACDMAGNLQEYVDKYVVVIDTENPVLDITSNIAPISKVTNSFPFSYVDILDSDTIEVFDSDIELSAYITEKNFIENRAKIYINNKEVENVLWNVQGDNHIAKIKLSDDGDYKVEIKYQDVIGETDSNIFSVSRYVSIDRNNPTVLISLSEAEYTDEPVKYYDKTVVAKFLVKEEKFNPKGLTISSVEGYNGMSSDKIEYLKDFNNWTYDEQSGSYTAAVTFNSAGLDGEYSFNVDFSDLAGNNAMQKQSGVFVIDTTIPELDISTEDIPASIVENQYPYNNANVDSPNDIKVFGDSEAVVFTIIEKNFFEDRISITVNGKSQNVTWNSVGATRSAIINLEDSGDYEIEFSYTDIFGNDSEMAVYEKTDLIAIDKIIPSISISTSQENTFDSDKKYFNSDVGITITAKDAKFRPNELVISDVEGYLGIGEENKNYLKNANSWIYDAENDIYSASIVLQSEGSNERYKFAVDYFDLTQKAAPKTVSDDIIIDTVDPIVSISYRDVKFLDSNNDIVDKIDGNNIIVFNNKDIVIDVVITEDNFDLNNVSLIVTKNSDEIPFSFDNEWTSKGNIHKNTITLTEEGTYNVSVFSIDYSLNDSERYNSPKVVLSQKAPSITFEVSPQNNDYYYNTDEVVMKIKVFDDYFNPKFFEINNLEEIRKDIDGKVISNNETDRIPNYGTASAWTKTENSEGVIFHYITLVLSSEGRYKIDASYQNATDTKSEESFTFVLDRTEPTYTIKYSNNFVQQIIRAITFNLYNPDVDVTFTAHDNISGVKGIELKYHNILTPVNEYNSSEFNPRTVVNAIGADDIKSLSYTWKISAENATVQAKGNISFKAEDNSGNTTGEIIDNENIIGIDNVAPVISSDITEEMQIVNLGVKIMVDDANFDPSYIVDEKYAFDIEIVGRDIGGNLLDSSEFNTKKEEIIQKFHNPANWSSYNTESEKLEGFNHSITLSGFDDGIYEIMVSGTDVAGNKAISYTTKKFVCDTSRPYNVIVSYSTPVFSKLISAVTFNYYNGPVVVTFTAEDSTSGVKRFDWSYMKEKGASNINVSGKAGFVELDSSERTAKAKITLPAGSIEQYRGNISVTATDRAGNTSDLFSDSKTTIVVDTISPTREIQFSEAKNEKGSFIDGGKLYYDDIAVVTINITEANFYSEDFVLKVNGDDYKDITWSKSGDVWKGLLEFSKDGHYTIKMKYFDRSTNKMAEYESGEIIVDKTAPEINVEFSPNKPVYTTGESLYFNEDQVATITIIEHNFEPSLIEVTQKSEDIIGGEIITDDVNDQLSSSSAWKSEGDVHVARVTYSCDANYSFSIKCTDLALNESDEYNPYHFTVDKTPPSDLSIKLSKSVADVVIENISFGFYNAPVSVSVSANDNISGIRDFTCSYSPNANSDELKTKTIDVNSTAGITASAKFSVPFESTQYKGNIKVRATDFAGNKTSDYTDKRVIVVDSVAPIGKIKLSDPSSTTNGVNYYSYPVTATLIITEENFFGEDVKVYVDDNQVKTSDWSNNGNEWTSTITINSDGQHQVSMSYSDKSGNVMVDQKSTQFVLDTTKPVIVVSGIQNNSANKQDTIGFVIKASDNSLVPSGFVGKLSASIRSEDGTIKTENINLPKGTLADNIYTVRVENIEKDGIYTLTCRAVDICGNSSNTLMVKDSNNLKTESLAFSVNRNGSTFTIDKETNKILNNYYIKAVDGNIVITETNIDSIKKSIVNLNGTELKEGVDYSVQSQGGNGEWNTRVYTINPSLFSEDGEYNIIVNSVDNNDTEFYSDIKGAKLAFVVDSKPPVITASGIESGGRYQSDKQEVSVIPSDDGGDVVALRVEITDTNGNVTVPVNASKADIEKYFNEADGIIKFQIEEGIRQNVKIICLDGAGNEVIEEYKNVTVSSNKIILLWSSTVFRVTLAIISLSAIGFVVLAIKKKK